ncbi:isoamyl acetate-hydrolyzing esterase 1 homolog isoform X1 [Octopus bimaculoides]|uniref:isoamyl acetate-hydrolyzing esterase 1 homolog isoform X1 n=1 Tax=Octopus bimaculoides TaxID=37653 RepID=UPI0022DEEFCF|nr:isoamyl acetate-hydrolyzing esterase 1 homolog isoform X1 [Octopus bimaculoides]
MYQYSSLFRVVTTYTRATATFSLPSSIKRVAKQLKTATIFDMAGDSDCSASFRWPKAFLFGDSITQYAFSHDGCWAALVADILQRKCDVINRGFSGYNSRWCKKILSSVLNKNELKDAVFVTIFLGANDCADEKINPLQHVPVDEYKNNMVEMVQMLQESGLSAEQVILISPPAVDEESWAKCCERKDRVSSNFNKNTIHYAAACKQAAEEVGTQCIDLYTEMMKNNNWKEMLNDGLHLSNKGSCFLFSLLLPLVEELTKNLPFILPYWADVDPNNLEMLLDGIK